jgi:hypothetical protein
VTVDLINNLKMGKGLDGGEVSFTTTLAPITATTQ